MRISQLLLASVAILGLAACQDSGLDLQASTHARVLVGPATPVAIAPVEGIPDTVAPAFSAALTREAQLRDIRFVDGSGAPRFRLKGYLNARTTESGTEIAWVWDVFDERSKRAQRVSGNENIRKSASDPWSTVDEAVLTRVAARSLNDIGLFLMQPGGALAAAPSKSTNGARASNVTE